jgi:hypothetical protein
MDDILPIADMLTWAADQYHAIAHDEINTSFPPPTTYTIVVDGVSGAAIETSKLDGGNIVARSIGNIGDLKVAFETVMSYLHSRVPSIFKRTTGYYETSAGLSSFFTILVNGREVGAIDWGNITGASNIQIFSKARYASPLESIKNGGIMLGARNAAKTAVGDGANISFTYRNPKKFGQVEQFSKSGRGKTARGEPFPALSVPVIELGSPGSNVTNYVGNVSRNLRKNETYFHDKNLIYRRILPSSRYLPAAPRTNPRRGPNRRQR